MFEGGVGGAGALLEHDEVGRRHECFLSESSEVRRDGGLQGRGRNQRQEGRARRGRAQW